MSLDLWTDPWPWTTLVRVDRSRSSCALCIADIYYEIDCVNECASSLVLLTLNAACHCSDATADAMNGFL